MSKAKNNTADKEAQTDVNELLSTSQSCSATSEKVTPTRLIEDHDRILAYFEEKYYSKYKEEDQNAIYKRSAGLINIVREASSYSDGLDQAVKKFKEQCAELNDVGKSSFLLIQFLEEYYTYFTSSNDDRNLQEALSFITNSDLDFVYKDLIGDLYYLNE